MGGTLGEGRGVGAAEAPSEGVPEARALGLGSVVPLPPKRRKEDALAAPLTGGDPLAVLHALLGPDPMGLGLAPPLPEMVQGMETLALALRPAEGDAAKKGVPAALVLAVGAWVAGGEALGGMLPLSEAGLEGDGETLAQDVGKGPDETVGGTLSALLLVGSVMGEMLGVGEHVAVRLGEGLGVLDAFTQLKEDKAPLMVVFWPGKGQGVQNEAPDELA